MTIVPTTSFRPSPSLRVAPWHGRVDVVVLGPNPGTYPTVSDIRRTLGHLVQQGVHTVFTPALGLPETATFHAAGFHHHEHLHLLRHGLTGLRRHDPRAPVAGFDLRRGAMRHVSDVIDLDGRAFDGFWRFDAQALSDARSATPTHRFRVAMPRPAPHTRHQTQVLGYAVTGRARRTAYLQRLAVDPSSQGHGVGTALIADALRWASRHKADHLLVNTQEANVGARRLYLRQGFTPEPHGLDVLVWKT